MFWRESVSDTLHYTCPMLKMKLPAAFTFLLLLTLLSCKQDDIEITNQADFEEFLAIEMEDQHIPALSVLIFEGEEILYEKYAGVSDLNDGSPLTGNDLFLMASVSKVITGVALLQLYEDGAFALDDPVSDFLPYALQVPGYEEAITFRMLLTHTAAIADNDPVMDEQYYYNQDPIVSLSAFMEGYFREGGAYYDANNNFYDFVPGTEHEYSNMGSALIGDLVQHISGQDFNAYCKEHIFGPLGMDNSFWRLDEVTGNIVTPYDYIRRENQAIEHYTTADYPNGGLRSTARDFHKILAALSNGGSHGNATLLDAETVQAMMTAQIPAIDAEVGLHFFVMNSQYGLWGHDGGEQGVATIVGFNPQNGIGAIVLSNQGEADLENLLAAAYELGTVL